MTAIDASSGWTRPDPRLPARRRRHRHDQPAARLDRVGVVHHSRSGMASGINNTFRQVGIATGVAGLGAVFQHQIIEHDVIRRCRARRRTRRRSPRPTATLGGALVSAARAAIGHSPAAERRARRCTHAYRVGFTDALTTILRDRLGHRAARCAAALRADPQPRLRLLGRARRASPSPRGARSEGGRKRLFERFVAKRRLSRSSEDAARVAPARRHPRPGRGRREADSPRRRLSRIRAI